jgi:hypothetical protein
MSALGQEHVCRPPSGAADFGHVPQPAVSVCSNVRGRTLNPFDQLDGLEESLAE